MPALIPAGIGAATSIIGGLIGSHASNKAAKQLNQTAQGVATQIDKSTGEAIQSGYDGITQSNAAINQGTGAANKYIGDAQGTTKDIYGNMTASLQPYQDAGQYGLSKMQSQGDFAFNPKDLENEPGYQFQLQQGQKALQAGAAGRGMLSSGATLKSMDNYSQGLAGTSYQNAYNRALSTFDTNRAGYQTLANMGQTANAQGIQAGGIYGGETTSLAGMGANANMQGAGLLSNTAMQGNEYIGDTALKGAEAAGGVRMQGAGAQAAGTIGAGNAWSKALGGVGGAAMYGLSQMNGGDPSSMSGDSNPNGLGIPGGVQVDPWSGSAGPAPSIGAYPAAYVPPTANYTWQGG